MRTAAAIRREIRAQWPEIVQNSGVDVLPALAALPAGTIRILGSGTKTEKGEKNSILTAILYMAPADEAFPAGSKLTLCAFATESCRSVCLGAHAGRLAHSPAKRARLWKTALFLGNRALFRELLAHEIRAHEKAANRQNFIPAVRLDGSSDTGIGAEIAQEFPGVSFYDYTKVAHRARKFAAGKYAANYHVTFSFSGENEGEALEILSLGGGVAVVFDSNPRKGEPIPAEWKGFPVFDADADDARFTDPRGGIVKGLRFKAAKDRQGSIARAGNFIQKSAA